MGLEKPNLGPDPGETFFPNSVSDLDCAETFQISRNLGLDIDENVCLLDSQLWAKPTARVLFRTITRDSKAPNRRSWVSHAILSNFLISIPTSDQRSGGGGDKF